MENKTQVASASNAQEAPSKVVRRGIASARGTQRLKFSHELAKPNGLFIAHLDSVVVSKILIGEDKTGLPSFNGLQIPRIVITFASNEPDVAKRHYVTISFTAVESNVDTIPGGKKEWQVNAVLDWFKHILNVYVLKGRELTEEESNALSLSYVDFDENGEYVPVAVEDVIASWTTLFENFANMLTTDRYGKPAYRTLDGKDIPVWIKLIRYNKTPKKGWQPIANGELAFPTFVGEGCIEIFSQQTTPAIRLDSIKEAIRPMNIESKQPKTPTIPGIGGAPIAPTMPMGGSDFQENIALDAAEDMPF